MHVFEHKHRTGLHTNPQQDTTLETLLTTHHNATHPK